MDSTCTPTCTISSTVTKYMATTENYCGGSCKQMNTQWSITVSAFYNNEKVCTLTSAGATYSTDDEVYTDTTCDPIGTLLKIENLVDINGVCEVVIIENNKIDVVGIAVGVSIGGAAFIAIIVVIVILIMKKNTVMKVNMKKDIIIMMETHI